MSRIESATSVFDACCLRRSISQSERSQHAHLRLGPDRIESHIPAPALNGPGPIPPVPVSGALAVWTGWVSPQHPFPPGAGLLRH